MLGTRALGIALALLAACAHAPPPDAPRLTLETSPRATARVGAARIELWIVNQGPSARRVAVDPDALAVAVASRSGQASACRPPSAGAIEDRVLAPGERAHVQLDLSRRCGIQEPGEYSVEVRHPAGPARTIELRVTRWVNPGPLGPGPVRQPG